METLKNQLEQFEPTDIHERNELNQLLSVYYIARDMGEEISEVLSEADLENLQSRVKALLNGVVHADRLDIDKMLNK